MIKNWLSRHSIYYPRVLIYMLQASEYNIRDYLSWYKRTENFANVERRKKFVKTPKAVLLLLIAWIIVIFIFGAAVFLLYSMPAPLNYILFIFLLFIAPSILAYGIIIMLGIIKILVQYPIEYFIIEQAKRRLSAHGAIKIAIAGSFGKTSMREILKTVLSGDRKVAAPPHSYNTPLGISQFTKNLEGDEEILVFELGEYYPGDVRKLCELVQPQIGIITGVNEAHLEKFKSLDKTASTIFELADWLGNNTLYVNGENEMAKESALAGHMMYDRNGTGDWKVKSPLTDLAGTSFDLEKNGQKFEFKSKLLGLHQIGPLVVAIDIADHLGIPLEEIKKAVQKTKPFDHRLELKTDAGGVITLDDSYNGNPDGARAVIDFLASLKNHRRFYVTPGLVETGTRTEFVHKEIGKNLAKAEIEKVILIKNSATPYIEKGLRESHYKGEIMWFESGLSAFAALPHLTVKGDIVLLQNDWPDQYQ